MALDKNKIIAEATKLVQKGAYEKAIRSYERILAEDPKDVRILLKIGELYQKKGDDRLAADAFKRVAETYADQGFFLKAVAVYKQVVKLDPDDVRVNERLAALYQQLGLMSDAMGQYQLMAAGYEKAGDGARLLDVLKRMVELDPDNIASSVKLGELHQRAGQTGPALEHFRRCAEYLKRHNRADEYLKVAERIAVLAPEDLALTRELAHAYLGRGDTKRALAKLQICFSKDRKDVETLNLLAQAFKELGQGSKQVQVYRELAHAYQEKGRGLDARAVWRKVLELVPDDAEAQQGLQAAAPPPAPAPAPPAPPPRQAATPPPARPAAAPPPARAPARAAPPTPPPEPLPPPAPVGGPEQIPKLLTETDVYLKYGLLDKALDHLRKVLAIDPQLPEAHERSRDIHAAAGRGQQAVTSAVAAVRAFLARGQQDRARDALARLKQLDPGHPELSGFGTSLGGVTEELHLEGGDVVDVEEVVEIAEDEVVEAAPAPTPPAWPARSPPPQPQPARFDASSEPSAELELAEAAHTDADDLALELARQEVAGHGRPLGPGAPAGPEPELQALPPLPDDDDLAAASAAAAYQEGEVIEESIELSVTPGPATSAAALEPEPPTRVTPFEPAAAGVDGGDVDLSDELEEVDFFLQQGLVDEARDALANLRAGYPEHPGVLSRLDAMAMRSAVAPPATAPSGFPAPPPERAPTPPPYAPEPARATPPPAEAAPPAAAPAELDIGRDLSDELDTAALPALDDEFQYSVEDVFSQFKKGVAETVKAEDSETHYDLGIAYKEMGLLDDAVHEFETAAQGSNRRKEVDCLAMIGVCRLAQDRPAEAIEALRRALRSDYLTREAAKAVHFDLGDAYQAAGDAEVALWCFQKVARLDPAYREVRGRVEALGGGPGRPPPGEPPPRPAQAGAAPSAGAPPPAAKKNVGYL